jgi:hypothetical protein
LPVDELLPISDPLFSNIMRKTTLQIRKRKVRDQWRWELTIPQKSGGRSRKYFTSKGEAETAFAQAKVERENFGTSMLAFPDRLRVEATKAWELLSPFGRTITDAVAFYLEHLEQTAKSRPVSDVVSDLLNARKGDGVSRKYLEDLRHRLARFVDSFGTRLIAEVGVSELEAWLRSLCVQPLTRNSYRMRLNTLFEFALTQGWCAKNPVASVARPRR